MRIDYMRKVKNLVLLVFVWIFMIGLGSAGLNLNSLIVLS